MLLQRVSGVYIFPISHGICGGGGEGGREGIYSFSNWNNLVVGKTPILSLKCWVLRNVRLLFNWSLQDYSQIHGHLEERTVCLQGLKMGIKLTHHHQMMICEDRDHPEWNLQYKMNIKILQTLLMCLDRCHSAPLPHLYSPPWFESMVPR